MRQKTSRILLAGLIGWLIAAGCSSIPCYRPEYYDPPAGAHFTAEEVRFVAPAGHTLAGTLTLPTDAAPPFPAVVLITGSSPQNRDMTGHWAWPVSPDRGFLV